MALRGTVRILTSVAFALPFVVGCAGVGYRAESTLSYTRYATVQNFGDEEITARQVDGLLEEVAELLNVGLDPAKPKVKIMVRPPSEIQALFRGTAGIAGHLSEARALYFPGANLVVIPYYSRTILGHELAHYLTDHYLKSAPRWTWERIAQGVEDALPLSAPAARRPTPSADVTAGMTVTPVAAPAN
jgi:hypothetical protein